MKNTDVKEGHAMKKWILLLLVVALVLPLVACDQTPDVPTPPGSTDTPETNPPVVPDANSLAELVTSMARHGIKAYLYGEKAQTSYGEVYHMPAAFGGTTLDGLLSDRENIALHSAWEVNENFYDEYGTEAVFVAQTYGITDKDVSDVFWITLSSPKAAAEGVEFVLVAANLDSVWKIVHCGAFAIAPTFYGEN